MPAAPGEITGPRGHTGIDALMPRFRNEENVIRETRRQQTIETNRTQIENDMLRNQADALSNGADAGRVIAQVDRVKELLDQGKHEEANYVVEQIHRRATVVGPDGELRYDDPSIDRVPAINNHPANRMVPESLSGNHDSTPIQQPANRMVPESLSGNHDSTPIRQNADDSKISDAERIRASEERNTGIMNELNINSREILFKAKKIIFTEEGADAATQNNQTAATPVAPPAAPSSATPTSPPAATHVPPTPTTGANINTQSTKNEAARTSPSQQPPTQMTSSPVQTPASSGSGFMIDPNDPGNVEPEDSASRYALLFGFSIAA